MLKSRPDLTTLCPLAAELGAPASVQGTKGLGLQWLDKALSPLLSSLWGVSKS